MIFSHKITSHCVLFEGWTIANLPAWFSQGPLYSAVHDIISQPATKQYFVVDNGRMLAIAFDMINWQAIGSAISGSSMPFTMWASKHVT
eukprot:564042-Ditylum_brightwellii.AAC.1